MYFDTLSYVCRLCRLVTKFEMAEANVLKTLLAARKVLHFIKFTPPFSTVGSFSEVRFRGSHYEASSNATPQDHSVDGVLGLSWGFGFPHFDIVKGTAVDYMHWVCERI